MPDPIHVDIYSRPGCHLCTEAKAILERVRRRHPFLLREINVETDPELERTYGMEIPVITINGNKACKYRVDEAEFEKKVQQLWNK
jgi:glutaredoxin